MSVNLVADFVARVHKEGFQEPKSGRVLLDQGQCVVVTETDRIVVPLPKVFDVGVGNVPPELRKYFDNSVTLAFERQGRRRLVVLEAEAQSMEKFQSILFSCLLSGRHTRVRHPAKRGGHVIEGAYRPGTLAIQRRLLTVTGEDVSTKIPIDAVTSVRSEQARVGEEPRDLIAVGYLVDGVDIETYLVPHDRRALGLLARFLRLEYANLYEEVTASEFSDADVYVLTALASGVTDVAGLVPEETAIDSVIDGLAEQDLVERGSTGIAVTYRGRIATRSMLHRVTH